MKSSRGESAKGNDAMTTLSYLLDFTIIGLLLVLTWQSLFCRSLFAAVVFFISFSLILSLAWVRLGAPDVALAEAAIGAGLTGALLLAALRRIQSAGNAPCAEEADEREANCSDTRPEHRRTAKSLGDFRADEREFICRSPKETIRE
jgi:uncharacterized MnhB-related membrane protein